MWLETDFPKILGAELFRPHPTFIAEYVIEPTVVHDFTAVPGSVVQLDRYQFWNQPGSKESRARTPDQTIGTGSSRSILKQKVNVQLQEFTGPADPNDPNAPSTFKVSRENLLTAQRLLLDTGSLGVFHQSIGSITLLMDYRAWRDRVFIGELYKCYSRGKADDKQGGYYFPGYKSESEVNATAAYDVSTAGNSDTAKFSVKMDLLRLVADMRDRNVPTFNDGFYRCLMDSTFDVHMRQDSDFREISRYAGFGSAPNPMMGFMNPNAINYLGNGPAYGQAGSVAGAPSMPVGFVFEGVKFFVTTNMPEYRYSVGIKGAKGFSAAGDVKETKAGTGMFFGPQAVGIGTGGPNAQVLLNSDDDFSRFIILIWQLYAGFEVLNHDFVTIAHSFHYTV